MRSLPTLTPARQLEGFLAKFLPEIAADARAALKAMRKRLPGAVELVYDNYNALAIGFGPGERASEAIFSIAVMPRYVLLCILQNGPRLKDPTNILRGGGNVVRNLILVDGAKTLDDPAVKAIMRQAIDMANSQIDSTRRNRMVIKSISAKQRPRRLAPTKKKK